MPKIFQTFTACIFDFDGVIVDSEPLHAQAKQITLDHFHIPYPANLFEDFKGRPDTDFFSHVAQHLASDGITADTMDSYKKDVYLTLFENVQLIPDALAFLKAARARYPKMGLATSATRRDFSLAAQKYHFADCFDVIVNGEDTHKHKPDPEPYVKAAGILGVSPGKTLVFEDSPNGVRAGKLAGCTVAALTTAFSAEALFAAGADSVDDSFTVLAARLGLTLP